MCALKPMRIRSKLLGLYTSRRMCSLAFGRPLPSLDPYVRSDNTNVEEMQTLCNPSEVRTDYYTVQGAEDAVGLLCW